MCIFSVLSKYFSGKDVSAPSPRKPGPYAYGFTAFIGMSISNNWYYTRRWNFLLSVAL